MGSERHTKARTIRRNRRSMQETINLHVHTILGLFNHRVAHSLSPLFLFPTCPVYPTRVPLARDPPLFSVDGVEGDAAVVASLLLEPGPDRGNPGLGDFLPAGEARAGEVGDLVGGLGRGVLHGPFIPHPRETCTWERTFLCQLRPTWWTKSSAPRPGPK